MKDHCTILLPRFALPHLFDEKKKRKTNGLRLKYFPIYTKTEGASKISEKSIVSFLEI